MDPDENLLNHEYSFVFSNITCHVLHNDQIDSEWLSRIQTFVFGWSPARERGFTICCQEGSKIGIYEIHCLVNLFAIIPLVCGIIPSEFITLAPPELMKSQVAAILFFIEKLIKKMYSQKLANEIRFKIAVYPGTEHANRGKLLSPTGSFSLDEWTFPGGWKYVRHTDTSICDTKLPMTVSEYAVRWIFDEQYAIRAPIRGVQPP